MSNFNLNDPSGFAALTSAFGSVAGPAQNQTWDIVESSFKNVKFHIFNTDNQSPYTAGVPNVHDKTGRRKVLYQFPFQDGQTTGDLGRAPFIFEFNVVFFGPNYLSGFQQFYEVLNQPNKGTLVHPVLGSFEVVPQDWEVMHESSERMALTMRVTFQEHNYDPGLNFQNLPPQSQLVTNGSPSTFKSAIVAALTAFQAIDSALTTVKANKAYVTSFVNGFSNLINSYKQDFLLTLQSIYISFSPQTVSLAPDLPGVLPVKLGGQVTTSGGIQSPLYPLTNSSNTPFSQISTPNPQNPQNLTPIQAEAAVNAVLASLQVMVQFLNSGNSGQGALDFYEQVLSLKQGGVQLRIACLQGIASSRQLTSQFTVPETIPVMSIREVAFAIGLDVNYSDQILQLNPQLLSVNFIPGGTVLQVPLITN